MLIRYIPIRNFARKLRGSTGLPKNSPSTLEKLSKGFDDEEFKRKNPEIDADITKMIKELGVSRRDANKEMLEGLQMLKDRGIADKIEKDITKKLRKGMSDE